MTVAGLMELASKLELPLISVTDHDTMANLPEVLSESAKRGVSVIPGIEISGCNPETGRKVHILGYCVKQPDAVTSALRPYLEERHAANLIALEKVRAAGYPIDYGDVEPYVGVGGILHRQHVMHALADRGYTATIYGELCSYLYGLNGIAVTNSRYISALDAIELVKSAGGFAVLAHPYQYDSMEFLPSLVSCGLDGIEYMHHTQTPERIAAVTQAAERYGLFVTGGTDWHGFYSECAIPPGSLKVELGNDCPLFEHM
jgi:predicted metal-dependent phosphoesterase TrpH